MSVVEAFSIFKDIALSVAAATMAFVAYNGIEKWKKELRGKTNFDTARALVRETYRLRDEMASCRSPFIPASEFPEDYNPLDSQTAASEGKLYAHIVW